MWYRFHVFFFFFKQKTAYEMRISDWSSDVCSSDLTMLGEKGRTAIPIVHLLAFAMPFMTVQVLFTPACDARGRPGIGVWNGATGSVIMVAAFLIGVRCGPTGLAWAWIGGYPLLLAVSAWGSLPVTGLPAPGLVMGDRPGRTRW